MNTQNGCWRSQKRAILRLALLVATPLAAAHSINSLAIADSPNETTLLLLPPLPLDVNGESAVETRQVNPFCQPAPIEDRSTVRATKPGQPTLGVPREVNNPLAVGPGSKVQLASGGDVESNDDRSVESNQTTVRLLPSVNASKADAGVTIRRNPIVATAETTNGQTIARQAEKKEPRKPIVQTSGEEGAVSFSLDDAKLIDTSGLPAKSGQEPNSLASLLRNEGRSDKSEMAVPEAEPVRKAPLHRSVTITEPAVTSNNLAAITRGSKSNRTLLVPVPSGHESMPVSVPNYPEPKVFVTGPVQMPATAQSDARIVKGGRPRVEVGLPSVAIARTHDSKAGSIAPVAKYSSLVTATSPSDAVFETRSPVEFQLQKTEVRSLKTASEIRRVQLGDSSVCSAIAAGSAQLQLIGTRDGMTRMAVWTAMPDGKEEKTVYEIRVGATVTSGANDPATMAEALSKSAKAAFPQENLQVRFDNGQMIVEGICGSEESAKKALRMIRSACLLPVKDKIVIR